jgi:hypothetical protein
LNGPRSVNKGDFVGFRTGIAPPAARRADKAKQQPQKTITRPLITAVLETITTGDDDVTTWCAPIAKLPAHRFAAALLMALALRKRFPQERPRHLRKPSRQRPGARQAARD